MDSSGEPDISQNEASAGERFTRFTRRNVLLVAVLFLSNLITAVSTLATAVISFKESRADWRPAEYKRLRELRAGYSLEKFKEELGAPAFRIPVDTAPDRSNPGNGYVRYIFRPRQEYWVEIIADRSSRTVTYAVTSCYETFNPKFSFRAGEETTGEFKENQLTLNRTPMIDVLPAQKQEYTSMQAWFSSTGGRVGFVGQTLSLGEDTDYRMFGWGLNDVCRPWLSDGSKNDSYRAWEAWYLKYHTYLEGDAKFPADGRKQTRSLMSTSRVNTYAESSVGETLTKFYPTYIGINRLDVR